MNPEVIDEATLQGAVIDALRVLGWYVAHFRPARTEKGWRTPVAADGKGFPDLLATHIKQKRLLAIELKGKRGKRTPEQEIWAEHFLAVASVTVAVEYHLWTPADWPDNVMDVIRRRP